MARMNQTNRITGHPRTRKPDEHNQAMQEAYAEGLEAYAIKHPETGEPLLHTAAQRRDARKRKREHLADVIAEACWGAAQDEGALPLDPADIDTHSELQRCGLTDEEAKALAATVRPLVAAAIERMNAANE